MDEKIIWICIGAGILISLAAIISKLQNNAGIQAEEFNTSMENIDFELRNLVSEGKKIEAIKRYRMVSGAGLKEAKDYVDQISEPKSKECVNSLSKQEEFDKTTENIDSELRNLVSEGKKIEAIRRYRMVSGAGVKEAKDYVEGLSEQQF